MKCRKCGKSVKANDNFCQHCGAKLKAVCDCWIKKGSYDCGKSNCPGYELFKEEKIKDQEISSPIHNQNQ